MESIKSLFAVPGRSFAAVGPISFLSISPTFRKGELEIVLLILFSFLQKHALFDDLGEQSSYSRLC